MLFFFFPPHAREWVWGWGWVWVWVCVQVRVWVLGRHKIQVYLSGECQELKKKKNNKIYVVFFFSSPHAREWVWGWGWV
jgi:hypothetical protein